MSIIKNIINYSRQYISRKSNRTFYKMNQESDSDDIKPILNRIEIIKKQLLELTDEVGQVQGELLRLQKKGRTIPNASSDISSRQFSTSSSVNKRKLIKIEENFLDSIDFDAPFGTPSKTDNKKSKYNFNVDSDNFTQVYTDGACENNGKVNAKAGLGVWFGDFHPLNVSKPVKGRATNNCGEIQACTEAINIAKNNGVKKLCINTDSQFVINSMTNWIKKWKKNGWKKADGGDVLNKVDFVELDQAIMKLEQVKFNYVPGHKNIKGNEEADALARQGAARYGK